MRSRGDPLAAWRDEETAPSLGLGILLQASVTTHPLSLGRPFVPVPSANAERLTCSQGIQGPARSKTPAQDG